MHAALILTIISNLWRRQILLIIAILHTCNAICMTEKFSSVPPAEYMAELEFLERACSAGGQGLDTGIRDQGPGDAKHSQTTIRAKSMFDGWLLHFADLLVKTEFAAPTGVLIA
jgi:hypothetical protein